MGLHQCVARQHARCDHAARPEPDIRLSTMMRVFVICLGEMHAYGAYAETCLESPKFLADYEMRSVEKKSSNQGPQEVWIVSSTIKPSHPAYHHTLLVEPWPIRIVRYGTLTCCRVPVSHSESRRASGSVDECG